jgi:hypothetical protein
MTNAAVEDLLKLRAIIAQRDAEIARLKDERDDLLNGHNKYSSDPTKGCVPMTDYLRVKNERDDAVITKEQMSRNFNFLLQITDAIAELVAPDRLGSWQQRAEWALSETTNTIAELKDERNELDICLTETMRERDALVARVRELEDDLAQARNAASVAH